MTPTQHGAAFLAAIECLKSLEERGAAPTPAERDILRAYPGAGPVALHLFPDPTTKTYPSAAWQARGEQLLGLCTEVEYESLLRSTFSAFYTSPLVMQTCFDILDRLGVPTTARVLEPGCGIGNFMAVAPDSMRFVGRELDHISARIALALYPQHDIQRGDMTECRLPQNLDAVIGNVPFADLHVDYNGWRVSLHEACLARSLDALRPGGIAVLVITHSFLDRQQARFREIVAGKARLLGAMRLPSTAFEGQGTRVVADIVVFQKHLDTTGELPGPEWLSSVDVMVEGIPTPISSYFVEHPDLVLGTFSKEDTLHGAKSSYSVLPPDDLARALTTAVETLPVAVFPLVAADNIEDEEEEDVGLVIREVPEDARDLPAGALYIDPADNVICERHPKGGVAVVFKKKELSPIGSIVGKRVALEIRMREQVKRVLDVQLSGSSTPSERQTERTRLTSQLAWFHAKHGPVNKVTVSTNGKDGKVRRTTPNLAVFKHDPGAMAVMALERYDEDTDSAAYADILMKDVVGVQAAVTQVATPEEALLASLDQTGSVDVPLMADLLGTTQAEVLAGLGSLVYQDPQSQAWLTADEYLSGNVRAKLLAAQQAGEAYTRNVDALQQVQPEDLLPSEIEGHLGAPWISPSDIEAFIREVCEAQDFWNLTVTYLPTESAWVVDASYRYEYSPAMQMTYGTKRMNGMALLEKALNLQTPKVYDRVDNGYGSKPSYVLNKEQTLAACEKQQQLKDAFAVWLWKDPQRAVRLSRLYNDLMNNIRLRSFDGSHLTFPGMAPGITLHAHQKDAVWAMMCLPSTLLAHAVGLGKAQPLTAKVLTPTGWVRMGDLRVGDEVIAGDGTATQVTGLFPQGAKEIFTVTFSDGAQTECCDEHLWLTQTYTERTAASAARRRGKTWPSAQPRVRTLADIRGSLVAPHLGAKNHSIPMVGAVECAEQAVPLDPYSLGVLLGDGSLTADTVTISKPDSAMIEGLQWPANVQACRQPSQTDCPTYGIVMTKQHGFGANKERNPVVVALESLGIMGKRAEEKFVPDCYKWNSAACRHAVLQGILDTDGWAQGGQPFLATSSARLADDVTFLVQSLGGTVHRSVKHPTYRHKGVKRHGRPAFVLGIVLPPEVAPFRLARKARGITGRTTYLPTRYIVRVEPCGTAQAQCITVAHPSHLYVTDDFVVTHNSYAMQAAAMKLRQAGRIRKPLFVEPNHMLEQFCREFLQLYPGAKLLLASTDEMTPRKRKLFAARVVANEWDGIVTTHSAFGKVGMSAAYQARFLRTKIAELEAVLTESPLAQRADTAHGNMRKRLEKRKAAYEEKLETLLEGTGKDDGFTFDQLGVDQLFVDEAQAYKNLDTPTQLEGVAGLQGEGSGRAMDMAMKVEWLQQQRGGRGVVFATGTPISNTMVEMYTMIKYIAPQLLEERGISHFDAWVQQFAEVVSSMEVTVAGGKMREKQRLAKYVNLTELQLLFRSFALVATADQVGLKVPSILGGKPEIISCPMTPAQTAIQNNLVERYEDILAGQVKPWEDNALAITTDGRKLALDARLVRENIDGSGGGKIAACAERILDIYWQTRDTKATQMVFCDMGVNETAWGFSAYQELVRRLVAGGMSRSEIGIMGEATTDAEKYHLFQQVKRGAVAVLIGSTVKMGTGTNVQDRLIALHHLDAPWKPAEIEQRVGRILRQGNMHMDSGVYVYVYITEGSFDAFMWQGLEVKARFINQIMHGNLGVREAKELDDSALSYAEVKAIATGNSAMLVLAKVQAECQRLRFLQKAHMDAQTRAQQQLLFMPDEIGKQERRLAGLRADLATLAAHPVTGAEDERLWQLADGTWATQPEAEAALTKWKAELRQVYSTQEHHVATYRGIKVCYRQHSMAEDQIVTRGEIAYDAHVDKRYNTGRSICRSTLHLLENYPLWEKGLVADIEKQRQSLANFGSQLGLEWPHEAYAKAINTLRRELQRSLKETLTEEEQILGCREAHEITADIETLHAQHGHKDGEGVAAHAPRTLSIAEPITQTIRARQEAEAATDTPTEAA